MATTSPFKRKRSRLVGTNPVQIEGYTVPVDMTATVFGLRITSRLPGQNITVSIYHQDAANNKTYIADTITVMGGGIYIPIGADEKQVMEAGDSMWVFASAANAVDVFMSIVESA